MAVTKDTLLQQLCALSPQEELLCSYRLLQQQDNRKAALYYQTLNAEQQLSLDLNAHYDGQTYTHFSFRDTENISYALDDNSTIPPEGRLLLDSYLGYFNIFAGKARRFSPSFPHMHTFYELYYVIRGVCTDTAQNRTITSVPGDVVILMPHTWHNLMVPGDGLVCQIAVRERTFRNICYDMFSQGDSVFQKESDNVLVFHTGVDPSLLTLAEDMLLETLSPHKYFNAMLQGQLSSFLAALLNSCEPDPELSGRSDHGIDLPQLMSYFQRNASAVSLESAAAHFGFSAPYFSKLVKQITGQNFTKIMQSIRMDAAAHALVSTDQTVQEICETCGYGSIPQFSSSFKRHFGQSPTAYRAAQKNNAQP